MPPEPVQARPRTVLVTGGAGYIGSVLVPMLIERGDAVVVLDRLYWGEAPLQPHLSRIRLLHKDVRTLCAADLAGVDAVVHLAGLSNDPTANYNTTANWEMNALATERLADACIAAGVCRLSFGSSCSLYDGLPAGHPYDERAAIVPRGAYAESKQYAEQALLARAGSGGFTPVLLRQATVYGLSPRMRYDLVVNTFVKDAFLSGRLTLHNGGLMSRPLVHVADAAAAHLAAIDAPEGEVRGRTFNVVHGNFEIRCVAEMVVAAFMLREKPIDLVVEPAEPPVRDYRCDGSAIERVLGFRPRRDLRRAIDELVHDTMLRTPAELLHPRHYNIRWMSLLEEIQPSIQPFGAIF
jgi:nucleoside-diphosphate-sugar epimerase